MMERRTDTDEELFRVCFHNLNDVRNLVETPEDTLAFELLMELIRWWTSRPMETEESSFLKMWNQTAVEFQCPSDAFVRFPVINAIQLSIFERMPNEIIIDIFRHLLRDVSTPRTWILTISKRLYPLVQVCYALDEIPISIYLGSNFDLLRVTSTLIRARSRIKELAMYFSRENDLEVLHDPILATFFSCGCDHLSTLYLHGIGHEFFVSIYFPVTFSGLKKLQDLRVYIDKKSIYEAIYQLINQLPPSIIKLRIDTNRENYYADRTARELDEDRLLHLAGKQWIHAAKRNDRWRQNLLRVKDYFLEQDASIALLDFGEALEEKRSNDVINIERMSIFNGEFNCLQRSPFVLSNQGNTFFHIAGSHLKQLDLNQSRLVLTDHNFLHQISSPVELTAESLIQQFPPNMKSLFILDRMSQRFLHNVTTLSNVFDVIGRLIRVQGNPNLQSVTYACNSINWRDKIVIALENGWHLPFVEACLNWGAVVTFELTIGIEDDMVIFTPEDPSFLQAQKKIKELKKMT